MSEYLRAFVLGNQAILTNVCLLPLYPGLIAFLAGNSSNERIGGGGRWLGLVVLAGVLSMMLVIGFLLYIFSRSFGDVLPVLLPVVYGLVIVFGLMMIAGFNPFARLATVQTPVFSNPYLTAYMYGLLLGPMTLPCTGTIITSAFAVGAGNFSQLADGLLYFLAFGLGFGWVLVVLPFLAMPLQRRFTGWLTSNYTLLTRFSGLLLLAIGLLGLYEYVTEFAPNV